MNPTTNGHAKTNGQEQSKPADVFRVEVRRVQLNETIFVRTLSEQLRGLFVHWYAKHSHYCPGKDCPPHIHKMKPTWKGYLAAEEWIVHRKKWRPTCLEITEHAELDMRFLYKRGQVWEIWRPSDPNKTNPPTFAVLREEVDERTLQKAFDFRPVLMNLYHTFDLNVSHANPLPPRIIAEEVAGDCPQALAVAEKDKPAAIPEDFSFAQEAARRLNDRKKGVLDRQKAK